jgi:hypothetical protein
MVHALTTALRSADLDPRDGATVNLARILAKSVDEGRMQDAPKLLACMAQLGLTPGGRRAPVAVAAPATADEPAIEESGGAQGVAALAAIRARRAAAAAAEGS